MVTLRACFLIETYLICWNQPQNYLLFVFYSFFPLLILAGDGKMCRIPQFDKGNAYTEGEGAAVGQLCKSDIISDKNCLVVSNDGDSLMYALLAGLQRPRNKQGNFRSELWVQLVNLQPKTSVYGVQNGKASEFWDINVLIYCIEKS